MLKSFKINMENTIFTQLSLVIVVGAIVCLIMRLLKQPLIIGYILTGIVVGPSFLHLIEDGEAFETFSKIGIALLLFIIGLGLNAVVIKSLGKVVLVTSLIKITAVGLLGYLVASGLGFDVTESIIMGFALIFSSTIIVIKALNDKREQTRLYGQIAIGVLLVEDILATIVLLFVAASQGGGFVPLEVTWLIIKALLLGATLSFIGIKVLPRLTKFFAESQEFLFLFALAWGFGIAGLFEIAGFSVEVGALFAGVSLASLPYTQEISARLKPLRDFFVVLFFIVLGESLSLNNLSEAIVPAILFSIVALVSKPLFIMSGLGVLGYTKRTSFKAGIHLSQISEFSIVLVILAVQTELVSSRLGTIVTLVAIITMAISAYLMKYDDIVFAKLENQLRLFERRVVKDEKKQIIGYPLVLFGYRKGGHEFVRTFRDMKKRYVVIDYNPEVIETMEHQHVHHMYGDATDFELLEEVGISQSQIIVSTITDFDTNKSLVQHIHQVNPDAVLVCHADNYDEAAQLYYHGATYVMLPHLIGSERIGAFMRRHGASKHAFEDYRQKHLVSLGRTATKSH